MNDKTNPFILPKEYYEMRERISTRFEKRLLELLLHERNCQINSLGH